MATVLIIDDDRVFCDVLSRRINRLGHKSVFNITLKDGIKMAKTKAFDVIMLDVQLPDGNGIETIPTFKELDYSPEIIIITGSGNPDGAELAIQCGAWDYIEKPATVDDITLPLLRALEFRKEKTNKRPLILQRDDIIGESQPFRACLDLVAQAAASDVNVLIQGETGTGKELLARSIHQNSNQSDRPFIVVDCGAIPESLVEGLLFGHEKGVFTGAEKKQIGLVEQANNGTLFLDEIGELPMAIQKTFLRVLQEKRYRRLGSKTESESNFRLICATNRRLEHMVQKNTFREDLLYRIRSFSIVSPPLRDRSEDISDLAMYYVAKKCEKSGMLTKGFSSDFFQVISAYEWPGNVRELFNTLESALTSAGEQPILFPQHLPVKLRTTLARSTVAPFKEDAMNTMTPAASLLVSEQTDMISDLMPGLTPDLISGQTYKSFKENLLHAGEKLYFSKICDLSGGDVKTACDMSGLSKSRLYFFLQKYEITLSDFKTVNN